MNNQKTNFELFSLLTSIYDIESNVFTYIRNKLQNFILSINRLFINNNWYNINILKYINHIFSKKFFPFIISSFLFIKSKISSVQFISEDFLNINIQNKNKFFLFLLLNSFEALIIKYIDSFFNFYYGFFFNSHENIEKVKYYGKYCKYIFKNLRNIQNIFLGLDYYKSIAPNENKNIFNRLDKQIKLIGYSFIIKNIYNIFCNFKNIYQINCIKEEKTEKQNIDEDKNNQITDIIKEDDNNENICLLCLNKYSNVCCAPCGHLFCWSCIHLYLIEKDKCPKCKMKLEPQEILYLQNYYI